LGWLRACALHLAEALISDELQVQCKALRRAAVIDAMLACTADHCAPQCINYRLGTPGRIGAMRRVVWVAFRIDTGMHCTALLCSTLILSLSLSLFASGRSTVCTHTHHTICGDQSQTLAVAAQLRCLQLLATLFDAKVLPDLSLSQSAQDLVVAWPQQLRDQQSTLQIKCSDGVDGFGQKHATDRSGCKHSSKLSRLPVYCTTA